MPVTLPDITVETVTVVIRDVPVAVRGFTLMEMGPLIVAYPGMSAALAGNFAAVMIDRDLLGHALATCAELEEKDRASLRSAEQAALLKEIFRLTMEDAVGPFVDLAASLGGAGGEMAKALVKVLSKKNSSPPSVGSSEAGTQPPQS